MASENQIQELQMLEQTMQNLLFQKQSFQIELAEIQEALAELKKSGEEIYKIIGQLMLKTDKSKTLVELEEKNKLLELRIKTLENQERNILDKIEKIRENLLKSSG